MAVKTGPETDAYILTGYGSDIKWKDGDLLIDNENKTALNSSGFLDSCLNIDQK